LQKHANNLQVTTAQTLAGVTAQVAENNVDLPVAVAANQQQGTTEQTQANEAVKGNSLSLLSVLLGITVTSKAAAIQTLSVENVGVNAAAASVATSSATTKSGKAGKAGKATAAAASTATTTATAKKGKNNNKRESGLKWAKRAFEESI